LFVATSRRVPAAFSPSCRRCSRSAFAAVVRVRVTLETAERLIPARLSVDRDEHQSSRPPRLIHPDDGRRGSRAPVDTPPHATGRLEILPARRRLALAFFEAI